MFFEVNPFVLVSLTQVNTFAVVIFDLANLLVLLMFDQINHFVVVMFAQGNLLVSFLFVQINHYMLVIYYSHRTNVKFGITNWMMPVLLDGQFMNLVAKRALSNLNVKHSEKLHS